MPSKGCGSCRAFGLLPPRGDVCGVGVGDGDGGAVVSRGSGPAGSRVHVHRASGLRGPRGRAAGGEVLMAGFTVSVDRADGERREVCAGCCRAFGCYYRVGTGVAAWPVACLALWGSLGRLLETLCCACPYISRCLGNCETLHLKLFGELRNPTFHAVWRIHSFSSVVITDLDNVGNSCSQSYCVSSFRLDHFPPPHPSFVSSWHSTAIARKRALSTQDPAFCILQNRAFPPNMRAQREPQNRVRDRTTLNHTTQ